MSNLTTASDFLNTLNQAHSVVSFTMETQKDGMLLFLGTQLLNRPPQIETKVYVKWDIPMAIQMVGKYLQGLE